VEGNGIEAKLKRIVELQQVAEREKKKIVSSIAFSFLKNLNLRDISF
jgi:hypothetical protein